MTSTIDTPHPAIAALRDYWEMAEALMGGTAEMRRAGERYLPKWPNEDSESYRARLMSATLFPAVSETIVNMVGRVFRAPLIPADTIPSQIMDLLPTFDAMGRKIDIFAQEVFAEALTNGSAGILVDFPPVEGATRADVLRAGARPYAVMIEPDQLINWRTGRGGVVEHVRFYECVSEPDGDYGTREVKQIRALWPDRWETYRKPDGLDKWLLHDSGAMSLGVVPYVPLILGDDAEGLVAKPRLRELMHLNIEHWQSKSDQQTILHVARVPILALVGVDDPSFSLQIGAKAATMLPTGGDMKFVEHSGNSIQSGRDDLKDIEERMRQAGAQLLKRTEISLTESQARDEAGRLVAPLANMAQKLEDALDQTLQLFALWLSLPDGGNIKVGADLDLDMAPTGSLDVLLKSAQAGMLSHETYFAELQRHGAITDEIDWETEQSRVDGQGPALGQIGRKNAA